MERKSGMLQPGVLHTLLAAAILTAAAGCWCFYLARTELSLLLCAIALLVIAVALMMCLHRLRKTFRALDDLEDTVEGWRNTPPDVLEQLMNRLQGPAGELGSSFYKQIHDMEENLAHVEERVRAKTERGVEQRIAREMRDRLLPRVLEDYPNRKNFEISGIVEDAVHPGSTYYDYFFIDSGLLCFSIAQFSQNDVSGLLQMVMAQTMLRGRLWAGSPLSEAMSEVNAKLFDYGSTTEPVAMLVATLNTWSGEVSLVNAGLPSPQLLRSGEGYERLGLPVSVSLGQVENVRYQESRLRLRSGNRLLLYTDGLGAMANREGVPFQEQALRAVINRSWAQENDLEQTLRFLADEAKAYCDICPSAKRKVCGNTLLTSPTKRLTPSSPRSPVRHSRRAMPPTVLLKTS